MQRRFRLKKPDFHSLDWRNMPKKLLGMATEGWYVKGDVPSQSRMCLLGYNYTANVISNLIGGSFYTGLLILINASDSFIGTLTMISTAANMMQVFAPILLERFKKRKQFLIGIRALIMLLNIVFIGVIPALPIAQQGQWTLLALSILVINLLNALISPGYTVWHLQSLPPNVRGSFFSLITMTVGAVTALCNLGGSAIVDAFKAHGNEYAGLLVLRGIALAIAAYDFYLLTRIKEYPYEQGEKMRVRDLLVEPFREKLYLRTVALTFLWNLCGNIPGSYYTVYLLKDLNINYSFITLCATINIPIVMLFTPWWNRFMRKTGIIKTLYIAIALYLLHYVSLAFVTEARLWLYPVILIYAYFTAIGINLTFASIPYINIPQQNQTVFIGFYSTMANMAALLGVTIGKYFIQWTEGVRVTLLNTPMGNKQLLVIVTAIVMALASFGISCVLRSLPEDKRM